MIRHEAKKQFEDAEREFERLENRLFFHEESPDQNIGIGLLAMARALVVVEAMRQAGELP